MQQKDQAKLITSAVVGGQLPTRNLLTRHFMLNILHTMHNTDQKPLHAVVGNNVGFRAMATNGLPKGCLASMCQVGGTICAAWPSAGAHVRMLLSIAGRTK